MRNGRTKSQISTKSGNAGRDAILDAGNIVGGLYRTDVPKALLFGPLIVTGICAHESEA